MASDSVSIPSTSESAQRLRAITAGSKTRLDTVPAARWIEPRGEDAWTRLEILGHLIDSAINNHQRFVRTIAEGGIVWPGYDQVAMVQVQQFASADPLLLLRLWESLNLHLAGLMGRISEEQSSYTCVIGGTKPCTLQFLAADYIRHLEQHLSQIDAGD